jgi:hypothetical protein
MVDLECEESAMKKPKINARAIIESAKKRKTERRKNVTLRVDGTLYAEFQSFCKAQGVPVVELFEDFMCTALRKPSIRQR